MSDRTNGNRLFLQIKSKFLSFRSSFQQLASGVILKIQKLNSDQKWVSFI